MSGKLKVFFMGLVGGVREPGGDAIRFAIFSMISEAELLVAPAPDARASASELFSVIVVGMEFLLPPATEKGTLLFNPSSIPGRRCLDDMDRCIAIKIMSHCAGAGSDLLLNCSCCVVV